MSKIILNNVDSVENKIKRFVGKSVNVDELLEFCTDNQCSDLYIKVGSKPRIIRYGQLLHLQTQDMSKNDWDTWRQNAISNENNSILVRQKSFDFSYEIPMQNGPNYRYRVNAGFSGSMNTAVFRMISLEIPSFHNINFPTDIKNKLIESTKRKEKITFIVGPTGSGKSIYKNQTVRITRKIIEDHKIVDKQLLILWSDLKPKDMFVDGSFVEQIMPWEYRPCFKLYTDNNEIIVSDEHIFKCKVNLGEGFIDLVTKYGDDALFGWLNADEIYNFYQHGFPILMEHGALLRRMNIFKHGKPQQCRCIKTNTGQYVTGDFTNHNTTTMTASINDFTQRGGSMDNAVIISLEDPIENKMPDMSGGAYIIQKEYGQDFKSWDMGVKEALREHPTFINVGETRDAETIRAIVDASRTGHGVITSFHASDVADTISRIYVKLSGDHDKSLIMDLIPQINLIVCQRIIPAKNKFQLQTQYLYFNEQIIDFLIMEIQNGNNLRLTINNLFHNEDLARTGILRNWH